MGDGTMTTKAKTYPEGYKKADVSLDSADDAGVRTVYMKDGTVWKTGDNMSWGQFDPKTGTDTKADGHHTSVGAELQTPTDAATATATTDEDKAKAEAAAKALEGGSMANTGEVSEENKLLNDQAALFDQGLVLTGPNTGPGGKAEATMTREQIDAIKAAPEAARAAVDAIKAQQAAGNAPPYKPMDKEELVDNGGRAHATIHDDTKRPSETRGTFEGRGRHTVAEANPNSAPVVLAGKYPQQTADMPDADDINGTRK